MEAPKPKSSTIKDGMKHHIFEGQELERFLQKTQATSLGIEDENGNLQSAIPVRVLRRLLAQDGLEDKTCQ